MNQLYLGQYLKLEQKLTPQQILLSTLLQLPMLSLEQRIKSELEQNPVLEEGIEDEDNADEQIEANDDEVDELEKELELHDQNGKDDEYDKKELDEAQDDTDLENLINDDETFEIKIPKDKNKEEYERPEISQTSLAEHLMDQLFILELSALQRAIGEQIIWNIRDDGYMDENFDLAHLAEDLETTFEIAENVLKQIHRFDPVGIGSRNLRECLLAQLYEQKLPDPVTIEIIKDYFEDFKNKRYDKLIVALDIDKERLQEAVDEVVQLNPKPGEGLFDSRTNYIIPDFTVEKIDGKFVVTLNDWNIPPLRISNTYKNMLTDKKKYQC